MAWGTRKIWKRVILGTSLFLIAALITTIVTMATVQMNFLPRTKDAHGRTVNTINLTQGIVFQGIYRDDTDNPAIQNPHVEGFAALPGIFNNSFKTTFLRASQAGATNRPRYTIETVNTNISQVNRASSTRYTILYRYAEPGNLRLPNGQLHMVSANVPTTVWGVLIVIRNNDRFGEVNIYFLDSFNGTNLHRRLTAFGNFRNLSRAVGDILYRETGTR